MTLRSPLKFKWSKFQCKSKTTEFYNSTIYLILSGKHSEILNTPLHQSFLAKARPRSRNKGGKKTRTFTIIRTDEKEIYCAQQKPCSAYMITSYLLKVCPEKLPLGNHARCSVLTAFTIPTTTWFKAQSTALCSLLSATVRGQYLCPTSHPKSRSCGSLPLKGSRMWRSFQVFIPRRSSKSQVLIWKTQYWNFAHVLTAWMALSYKGCIIRVVSFSVVAYIKIGKIIEFFSNIPFLLLFVRHFYKSMIKCGNSATAGLEKHSILNQQWKKHSELMS